MVGESGTNGSFVDPLVSKLMTDGSVFSESGLPIIAVLAFAAVDAGFVSGASDLMGGDSAFDDSESELLSDVVFAVVESVLVRGAFDLSGGESVSNDSGLISVASDFVEAKSVSDDSKSRLLNVVFVPVLVDAFVVLSASGLMVGDCISDESE